jgi:antitoxin MazE
MKAQLIKIGNSRGVRIPKAVIEQVGLQDEIVLDVRNGELAIRPAKRSKKRNPREGWEEAAKLMAARGDDALIDGPLPALTSFDHEEWEW